jgi:hypothetical protein
MNEMALQVRYVTNTARDFWLAESPAHPTGVWVHDPEFAIVFQTEADAKLFLIVNCYDLPAANVVFEAA